MIRDPYARQIWRQTASASRTVAVTALMAAGTTELIADSAVGAAPGVTAVITVQVLGIVFAAAYLRDCARRIRQLREQQAMARHRHMRRRSRERVDLGDKVDPRDAARDERIVAAYAAEEPAETDQSGPAPSQRATMPLPPLDDTVVLVATTVATAPWDAWFRDPAGVGGGR